MLKQWFLRITDFQDALLNDLSLLAGKWPDRVLSMQKNWLGRSEGARFHFEIVCQDEQSMLGSVEIFTTRPDTLFGVQYVALAANHPIVLQLARADPALREFLAGLADLLPDSKAGYQLPGVNAVNPLKAIAGTSLVTSHPLPVFVAPYVLGDYGGGAVMGVPGHDSRDSGTSTARVSQFQKLLRLQIHPLPQIPTNLSLAMEY